MSTQQRDQQRTDIDFVEGEEEPTSVEIEFRNKDIFDFITYVAANQMKEVEVPDILAFQNGQLNGLFWYAFSSHTIEYDPTWPHTEIQQEKLFSVKKITEQTLRTDMVMDRFVTQPAIRRTKRMAHRMKSFSFDDSDLTEKLLEVSMTPKASKHVEEQDPNKCVALLLTQRSKKHYQDGGAGGTQEYSTANCMVDFSVTTRYLSAAALQQMVDDCGNAPPGLLLAYEPPANGYHNLVRVIFTPYVTKIEKHESIHKIEDENVPLQERTATAYNSPHARKVETSATLKAQVNHFCHNLYEFFRRSDLHLQRAIFFFHHVSKNCLHFLWCNCLDLKPLDEKLKPKSAAKDIGKVEAQRGNGTPVTTPLTQSESVDQVINMFDDIHYWGFWGTEPRRIKNSLKKQIHMIVNVSPPQSMELDDRPPYSTEFIQALCDPKKAERYFFRFRRRGRGHGGGGDHVGRRMSMMSMMSANNLINRSISNLSAKYAQRHGSLASHASQSSNQKKNQDQQPISTTENSPFHNNNNHSNSPSATHKNRSPSQSYNEQSSSNLFNFPTSPISKEDSGMDVQIVVGGPDETQNQEQEGQGENFHIEEVEEANTSGDWSANSENMQQMFDALIPDPKHQGHVLRLRQKYGSFDVKNEASQILFMSQAKEHRVSSEARKKVERILAGKQGGSKKKGAGSTQPTQKKSASQSNTRPGSAMSHLSIQSKRPGWVDVTHQEVSPKLKPIVKKASTATGSENSAVAGLVRHRYPAQLHEGDLMNYLVQSEKFEKKPKEKALDVTKQELLTLERRKQNTRVKVPDAPVVEVGNTFTSISEEVLQKKKHAGYQSRNLLDMLFVELDRGPTVEEIEAAKREEEERQIELTKQRLVAEEAKIAEMEQRRVDAAARQRANLQLQTHYGSQRVKEELRSMKFAFEDLLYRERSEELRQHHRPHQDVMQEVIVVVPQQDASQSKELQSILLGAGFQSRPIREPQLLRFFEDQNRKKAADPSVESERNPQDAGDYLPPQLDLSDEQDEENTVPVPTKEFYIANDSVLLVRAHEVVDKYCHDVLELYRQGEWGIIERIRHLMDDSGYTMYDAVTAVRKK